MNRVKWLKVVMLGGISALLISGCSISTEKVKVPAEEQHTIQVEKNQVQVKSEKMSRESILKHLQEYMIESVEGNLDVQESANGNYICGIDYESNHLVVLNDKDEVIVDQVLLSPLDETLNLKFYAWGEQKERLWLTHNRTYQVKDFVYIDLMTGETNYYEQIYGFDGEFALEPDTGYLCFSDFPIILDVDERAAFLEADHEITLSLVNLLERESPKIIETSINRAFEPEWIGDYSFTYNNPYLGENEIEKVTYAFNQPFNIREDIKLPITYETHEIFREKYNHILKVLKDIGSKTDEVISLYGYDIPIKDILIFDETGERINEKGIVQCFSDEDDLLLFIDNRQAKDINQLANFLGIKYEEDTVRWFMEKFINEKNSYTIFEDGSYIEVSLTTAGFKSVRLGYIQDASLK